MSDDNSERRTSSADIRDIARCYHALDTRVAVLETRIDGQDQRLGAIEADIREIKSGVRATLLSVLGFFGALLFDRILPK